ncbi:hypothetical protein ACJJTC_009011 [Scirpophaga incertulas]
MLPNISTWLTENWESDIEIKTRIEVARSSFNTMKKTHGENKLDTKGSQRRSTAVHWKKARHLWDTFRERKVAYLGHIFRHERYEHLQLIMMGKIAGRRSVGCRRKSWLRNIREWTGIASAAQLFRLAKDRIKYTELTANLR